MDTIELYVVAGPSEIYYGGKRVPGGFDYLNVSLRALSQLNPTWLFNVKVAHSVYHGPSQRLSTYKNLSVDLTVLNSKDIADFDRLGPSLQHGTLLNYLLAKSPPQSRFVIILDPDCFVAEKGIVNAMTQVMLDKSIGIVGLPYPAWYPKEYSWRSPQVYFCVFDSSLIDPSKIDFRAGPDLKSKDKKTSKFDSSFLLKSISWLRRNLLRTAVISQRGVTQSLLTSKYYLLLNRHLTNPFDTGWQLAEFIDEHQINSLLCPFIVDGDICIAGFNRTEFLEKNPDLLSLSDNLGWYFLNHALIEGKDLGSQGLIPKALKKLTGGVSLNYEKWPISALVSSANLTNKEKFRNLKNKFPWADFYSFAGKISFFHLGTQGKGRMPSEIRVLENLIQDLINQEG